ncbi:Large neutral amino acids transporter small [Paragonimus heterotremus]|uniref:Large neutral amino acids transporter small n=1 Tax=Paragonimus heterotremus TaxID=100268 RepID=A0A8J4WS05_9TREM|nr:Large neutral amino acids transporter small [Paragonimus heterotremus]
MAPTLKNNKKAPAENAVGLKKEIGILQGVSIVVGIIVGSGIFVSPVGVLRNTQSVGLSFIMWFVTGLFSTLGAIVYAELGVTIPRSGGEYTYILETFGPFLAFMALWITFVVIGTVACAVNSLILAEYLLRPFFFDCDIPKSALQLIALLALLTLCFINCYRVTWATKLSIIFTTCKVVALLLIVGFGSYYLARGNVNSFRDPFEDSAVNPGALANAFYQGFWAFAGWNYLNFLTGEMKNPARNLPIVIVLSLSIVTLIYLLANMAYLAVLSPFEILSSEKTSAAVAVTFASQCMGVMAWVMPIFVGASVFGSINGEVLSMSRLCFTASEEGHMPTIFSMISVTNLTPIPSVLAMILLSILFQLHEDVFVLIKLTGLAFTVVSAMAVSSLLHIRRTNPGLNKSRFKLPIFLPILYLIVNISIGIFSIYDSPNDALLSVGLMALGIPVYVIFVAWKRKPAFIESRMYRTTVCLQKVFNVVQQEASPNCIEVSP